MSIFSELKVVELASVLAGPSVGQFFAELGAKVIKVENMRTEGDVTRSWRLPVEQDLHRDSAYFLSVNWGKESVWLDLTEFQDRKLLLGYLEEADIVLVSYKPGDAQKLGLDYETLRAIRPTMIYAAITGYGEETARTGYDAVIQAESGFMSMNGEPEGGPLKMPVALIDVLAGHHLKEAILVALLHRQKTGEGSYCSVSLFDAAIASLVNQASNYLNAGHLPARLGNEHPNIVPYGTLFRTADGQHLLLAVGSDEQFRKLCQLLDAEDLATDPRFSRNAERNRHRKELLSKLSRQIALKNADELSDALAAASIPAGIVRNMAQVFSLKEAQRCLLRAADERGKVLFGIRQWIAKTSLAPFLPILPPK